jgi:hypothetical protein
MFRNTRDDLEDCLSVISGENEHYQSREDIDDEEYDAFRRIVDICRDIVRMDDRDNHVFVVEEEDDDS